MSKSSSNARKPWTPEANRELRQLIAECTSLQIISLKLGRTIEAIQTQAGQLGISLKPVQRSQPAAAAEPRTARPARNTGRPWTPEANRELRELIASGTPIGLISLKLGRTVDAVQTQAGQLGISLRHLRQEPEVLET